MGRFQLRKIDRWSIPEARDEMRGFACVKDEILRLPYFLDYHRALGVERFFIIDNRSQDGTRDFLLKQPDVHCFDCGEGFFAGNVDPPRWSNALLNVFGEGHWCLTLDPDELLVYPHCESIKLRGLCSYLNETGADTLVTNFVDMYRDGPILAARYKSGQSFVEAFPYFDPTPGWTETVHGRVPPTMAFGGVRERAFWRDAIKRERPPCLTKVPLVRWRRGMRYLIVNHTISEGVPADVSGALLHFKFMPDFAKRMKSTIAENAGVAEKGLQERAAYVATLSQNPKLSLRTAKSARYRDSRQLVELGLMTTAPGYEAYAKPLRAAKAPPAAPPRKTRASPPARVPLKISASR